MLKKIILQERYFRVDDCGPVDEWCWFISEALGQKTADQVAKGELVINQITITIDTDATVVERGEDY